MVRMLAPSPISSVIGLNQRSMPPFS